MPETRSIGAVIVAAGSGSRFGSTGPRKQFRELLGAPVLAWAARPFVEHPRIHQVVLVLPAAVVVDPPEWLEAIPARRVAGGAERSDSVRRGLGALAGSVDQVLIHDGARPLITRTLIDRILEGGQQGAAIPGLRLTDTVKETDPERRVLRTVDRTHLWQVQTPQAFPLSALLAAHERAHAEGVHTTDDAALFERYGLPVRIVEGDPANLKITGAWDLRLAELLAQSLPPTDRFASGTSAAFDQQEG